MPAQKRKRAASSRASTAKEKAPVIKDEWEELPHNMGKAPVNSKPQSDTLPLPKKARVTRSMAIKKAPTAPKLEFEVIKKSSSPPLESKKVTATTRNDQKDNTKPTRRSPRGRAKFTESDNLKDASPEKVELNQKAKSDPIAAELKKETPSAKKDSKKIVTSPDVVSKAEDLLDSVQRTTKKKPKKTKDNPYGLTPGYSPFPDWETPTAEQCQEVTSLLASVHSLHSQPTKPPAPSTTVAGCGEVPAVLDAMIRTLLSAATSGRNSSSAFQGLLKKFGTQEEGVGKGSVNWHKVREAPLSDVFDAIKSGGLAKVKSAKIKEILDIVFEQNTARRAAMVAELEEIQRTDPECKSLKEKERRLQFLNEDMLSLNHFHEMESEDAMTQLTKFPNIGVKTASCILLFCLQRPSFAVDTHVWRMCKWLGWVPPTASRDETFSHLEVKCPNELKYPLHQLLIAHGKKCGRCRANTGLGSQDYVNENCPVDHLVTRTGKRKGGEGESPKKGASKTKAKDKKKKKGGKWDDEEESDELSELDSNNLDGDE